MSTTALKQPVRGAQTTRTYDFSRLLFNQILPHLFLITYSALALFPIALAVINSFKSRANMFRAPFELPLGTTFTTAGYELVFDPRRASAGLYLQNSLIVTIGTLICVILFGAMAAWALSEYHF